MAGYGSVAGVEALVPAVAGAGFDASSTPTSTEIDTWLDEAYALINAALSGAGYSIPVSAAAGAYALLTALENLYGAAYTLRAYGMETHHDEQENTSEIYLKDFHRRLKDLTLMDLTGMGVTLRPVTSSKTRIRRLRSLQVRRIDGYSARYGPERNDYASVDDEDSD